MTPAGELLPDDLASALIAELMDEDVVGLTVVGSYARGTASSHSDVDVTCFVRQPREGLDERYRLSYRDGRLVYLV